MFKTININRGSQKRKTETLESGERQRQIAGTRNSDRK